MHRTFKYPRPFLEGKLHAVEKLVWFLKKLLLRHWTAGHRRAVWLSSIRHCSGTAPLVLTPPLQPFLFPCAHAVCCHRPSSRQRTSRCAMVVLLPGNDQVILMSCTHRCRYMYVDCTSGACMTAPWVWHMCTDP